MFSILVAEDDETLNKLICAKLKQENYHPIAVFDGEEALEALDKEHVDMIISDIMMPKLSGYELARELRGAGYTVPILMVTAKNQLEDMEDGFGAGADDYMVKPINMKEMMLRVKALLRRAKINTERKLTAGESCLDYDALTVTRDGQAVELPKKEFYLLFKLLSNPNKIFTRQQLMDEIWGMDSEADDRTVDSHIKKLRRKFETCNDFELVTVRGLGYKAKL